MLYRGIVSLRRKEFQLSPSGIPRRFFAWWPIHKLIYNWRAKGWAGVLFGVIWFLQGILFLLVALAYLYLRFPVCE